MFIQKHFNEVIEKIRSSHNIRTNDRDSIVNVAMSVDGKSAFFTARETLPIFSLTCK